MFIGEIYLEIVQVEVSSFIFAAYLGLGLGLRLCKSFKSVTLPIQLSSLQGLSTCPDTTPLIKHIVRHHPLTTERPDSIQLSTAEDPNHQRSF